MSRRNYATAFKRYSRTAIPLTAVIGAAAYLTDSKISKRAEQNAAAAFRIINLLGTVSIILTDYGCSLYFRQRSKLSELELYDRKLKDLQSELERLTLAYLKDTNGSSSARLRTLIRECRIQLDDVTAKIAACSADTFLEEIHERNAVRLLQMCRKNKGVYIKLGQHLSMLDHIVPDPYRRHLSNLLANNPVTPWKAVEQIILEDFGEKAKTFFSKIEPDPLASASLAQVHVAYGTDGKKYAVKVQHDGLLECSQGDMVTITFLVDLIPYLFKGFNYKWLTTEMNKNLPLELNFENEKSNLEKCRTYLKDMIAKGVVALPEVKHELCSKRILTMSFEEGVYVSDRSKLLELGLNPQTISRLISEIFCEQIFIHGFVHCDPHEANLLVRPNSKDPSKPVVVLLDHGLYRNLDEEFRLNYCHLWQSLICSDEKQIEHYCKKLNAGAAYTLLAAMLTLRPWDDIVSGDIDRLKHKNTNAESVMLAAYAQKYFVEIIDLLGKVPSELLLLLKTNDCLRHLDKKLDSPFNSLTVVADVTSRVIFYQEFSLRRLLFPGSLQEFSSSFATLYSVLELRIRKIFLTVLNIFYSFCNLDSS